MEITKSTLSEKCELAARVSALVCIFFLPMSTSITDLLFTLTMVLSVCAGRFQERFAPVFRNPIAWLCIALYLLYPIGATYSIGNAQAIWHQVIKFHWLIGLILIMPLFKDSEWAQQLLNVFLTSTCIVLVLSYGKFIFIKHAPYHPDANALVFKDYIVQNLFFSMSGLIFLYRALRYRILNRLHGVLSCLFLFNTIFLGASRTVIILLPVLAMYLLIQLYKWRGVIISVVLSSLILVAILFAPTNLNQRFHDLKTNLSHYQTGNYTTSIGFRLHVEKHGLQLWLTKPWIGYGTGGIKQAYANLPGNVTQQTGPIDNASSDYLNYAIQFGSIGLALFLLWLASIWYYSSKLPPSLQIPLRLFLIALIIGNVANSWLTDTTPSHLMALFLASFLANIQFATKRVKKPLPETTAPIQQSPDSA